MKKHFFIYSIFMILLMQFYGCSIFYEAAYDYLSDISDERNHTNEIEETPYIRDDYETYIKKREKDLNENKDKIEAIKKNEKKLFF